MEIHPASKNQMRQWRKLRQKKYREREGLYIISGWNAAKEFLSAAGHLVNEIIVTETKTARLNTLNIAQNIPVFTLKVNDFSRLSEEQQPQGLALVARMQTFEAVKDPPREKRLVYLDRISDPGNLGTIIRSAVWFGLNTLLLSAGSADPFQPKAVRASAGAIGRMKIYREMGLPTVKQWIDSGTYSGIATVIRGGQPAGVLRDMKNNKIILFLGSEAHGLSSEIRELCRKEISIPRPGFGESLNLSVASGILFYLLGAE